MILHYSNGTAVNIRERSIVNVKKKELAKALEIN